MWLGCAGLLPGCGRRPPPKPSLRPDVVASVDGVPITVHDVLAESERLHAVSQAAEDPRAFLQRLVDREALVSAALREGLHRDPEVRRQYENLLIGALRQRRLEPRLAAQTVSEDDVRAWYEANLDRYRTAGSIRVAVLRLQCRPGKEAEAKATLEAVRVEAAALPPGTQGFGDLAATHSDHQASRYQGGDIGWLRDGKGPSWLPGPVISAAWSLETPGQMSGVLVEGQAVYLVRLIERKEAATRPLAETAPSIRAALQAERHREAEEAFVEEAREAARITVQEAALAEAARQLRQRAESARPSETPPLPVP